MSTPFPAALPRGKPAGPVALPLPLELPDGLGPLRVLQLANADAVSRGASNEAVRFCLDLVRGAARALDPQARIRCAASSKTAARCIDVLTTSGNNQWAIRHELNGADHALLEELGALINARMMATRPARRKRPGRVFNLVILVAQDSSYSQPVRQLRLMGIPCWLVVPGRYAAASLLSAATAVSFIDPGAVPR
jgi:hypothetical protein